ncbi:MAG: short-chain dehydrogenase [Marinilabiliales bacterium]|nr:MAG: short-chain dehydrogenase [Marinilabiliales bacterium]
MKKKTRQYIKEYKWSNVWAMIKNNRKDPKICTDRFSGKLVVITGATSGIGYLTAKKFAEMGADLFCINRNLDKSEKLKQEIESSYSVKCKYHIADLSKLSDIHSAADTLVALDSDIDVLIHNAGVYLTKPEYTEDNLEKTLVVHYLSTFIINYKLQQKLKAQHHARIIMVGSEGHRFAAWGIDINDLNWRKRRYSGLKSYGSAKTAQLLSMIIFHDIFQDSGVTINTMHPGAVKTETGQENGPVYKWFKRNFLDKTLRPVGISADAIYFLAADQSMKSVSGRFFNLTTDEDPAPPATDREVAEELWKKSIELSILNNN